MEKALAFLCELKRLVLSPRIEVESELEIKESIPLRAPWLKSLIVYSLQKPESGSESPPKLTAKILRMVAVILNAGICVLE